MSRESGTPSETAGVTLVCTLLDEAETLEEWWESIIGQTRLPDEMVVVDGGSTDGTVEELRSLAAEAPFEVRLEVLEGSNIAQGRNRAIELAGHRIIAVTDGGCVLDPRWLENLLRPLEKDASLMLSAGFYRPLARGWFQELAACATLPLAREIRGDRFMPSSRSLAFRRGVWEMVGGYPEWLEIGEDMYFNHAWKRGGITHAAALDALAYWRMREDLPSFLRQYFLYARGDGEAGMYPGRHLLRFAAYGWLLAVAGSGLRARARQLTLAAGCLYAAKRWARIPVFMAERPAWVKMASVPAVPFTMFLVDLSKMAGYLAGRIGRRRT